MPSLRGRRAPACTGRCDSGQDAGVWGGLTEDERRALKRRRPAPGRASSDDRLRCARPSTPAASRGDRGRHVTPPIPAASLPLEPTEPPAPPGSRPRRGAPIEPAAELAGDQRAHDLQPEVRRSRRRSPPAGPGRRRAPRPASSSRVARGPNLHRAGIPAVTPCSEAFCSSSVSTIASGVARAAGQLAERARAGADATGGRRADTSATIVEHPVGDLVERDLSRTAGQRLVDDRDRAHPAHRLLERVPGGRRQSIRRACSRSSAATVCRLFFTRWWISRIVASLVSSSRSRRRSSVTSRTSTSAPTCVAPVARSGMRPHDQRRPRRALDLDPSRAPGRRRTSADARPRPGAGDGATSSAVSSAELGAGRGRRSGPSRR